MYKANLFLNDPLPNLKKDTVKILQIIDMKACAPQKLLIRIKRIQSLNTTITQAEHLNEHVTRESYLNPKTSQIKMNIFKICCDPDCLVVSFPLDVKPLNSRVKQKKLSWC